MVQLQNKQEAWRKRLFIPNYQIGEAARYAQISPQTVRSWHQGDESRTLSRRANRTSLSYLQLIEVAVVAAMRKSGITLKTIRSARDYVQKQLHSEYPFAEYKFKADGKSLFMDFQQIAGKKGKGMLLRPDRNGQLAWADIIGRLDQFDYERGKLAIKWHLAGRNSPVVIDPKVAFGAPSVKGIATWVLKGRWEAGEDILEIANDFNLKEREVVAALKFEQINMNESRQKQWRH